MKALTSIIRGAVKSSLAYLTFGLRLHHLLLSNSAIVVAFHRVNNSTEGDGLTCGVEMFKRYCQFFADYFHVISLGDLVGKMERCEPLNRELAITFDDGYQDNYEYAAPVLKAIGLPATFFVVTQFIETEFVPCWDRNLSVRQPWMTWDQVRWLSREGFEIGSHTRTHANMGEMFGDRAREEIVSSRFELEEKLTTRIELFAYPYGGEHEMTEENREIVKASGLRCCCSCFGRINNTGTDPFHLRRIPISSWYESPHHLGFEVVLRHG